MNIKKSNDINCVAESMEINSKAINLIISDFKKIINLRKMCDTEWKYISSHLNIKFSQIRLTEYDYLIVVEKSFYNYAFNQLKLCSFYKIEDAKSDNKSLCIIKLQINVSNKQECDKRKTYLMNIFSNKCHMLANQIKIPKITSKMSEDIISSIKSFVKDFENIKSNIKKNIC